MGFFYVRPKIRTYVCSFFGIKSIAFWSLLNIIVPRELSLLGYVRRTTCYSRGSLNSPQPIYTECEQHTKLVNLVHNLVNPTGYCRQGSQDLRSVRGGGDGRWLRAKKGHQD